MELRKTKNRHYCKCLRGFALLFTILFSAFLVWLPANTVEAAKKTNQKTVKERFPNYATESEILAYLKKKYPPTRSQDAAGRHYGCCWAVTATTLMEFGAISNGLSRSGKNLNYSETALAYATYHNVKSTLNDDSDDKVSFVSREGRKTTWLGIGGNPSIAAYTLMTTGAVEETGGYAFVRAGEVVQNGFSVREIKEDATAQLWSYRRVDLTNYRTKAKEFIRKNGAIGLQMYYDDSYMKGYSYYTPEENDPNHVVTIVGYDDSYPASKFKNGPKRSGAWLVRNSEAANAGFSKKGYFWLSYYDKGIRPIGHVYEVADQSQWHDGIYSYNTQTSFSTACYYNQQANVYTATCDMNLYAIQYDCLQHRPGHYTVKIYKDLTNAENPESGRLVANANGYEPYSGRVSVKLNRLVALKPGTTFSIVMETENGVSREMDLEHKDQVTMDVSMGFGESFVKRGSRWRDLRKLSYDGTEGNLCIRALVRKKSKDGAAPADYLTVYEYAKNGKYRYTTKLQLAKEMAAKGWSYRVAFYAPLDSSVSVYSIYDKKTKTFRFTTKKSYAMDRKAAGKAVHKVFSESNSKKFPVYEMKQGGTCRYVLANMARRLKSYGWKVKRIAFYAEPIS